MESVLIVDDEESIRKTLSILLKRNGLRVEEATNGLEALAVLANSSYDLVIADLNMPEMSGIDLLKQIKEEQSDTEVIILTAYGAIQSAVEAIKIGAYDYLTKPIEPKDIMIRVRNAIEKKRLTMEVRHLKRALRDSFSKKTIVGQSPAIVRIFDFIDQVSATDSTVLIYGETGTGKELVARAIHGGSRRRDLPFIPINCGALPESLLEAELFGYEKGAFTGALASKKGLFEEADRGTIFLDEISATSPMTQVKLLRVLQEQEIRRVGSNKTVKIDVKVIGATNRDLAQLVREGKFRPDLYYRLNVISIEIPPLRKRKEDLPLLVEHFLKEIANKENGTLKKLSPEAMKAIYDYDWPGNVRELRNALERATVLSKSPLIECRDLPRELQPGRGRRLTPRARAGGLKGMEKEYIEHLLKDNKWNYSKTARELGIARNTLLKRIEAYGLHPPRRRLR